MGFRNSGTGFGGLPGGGATGRRQQPDQQDDRRFVTSYNATFSAGRTMAAQARGGLAQSASQQSVLGMAAKSTMLPSTSNQTLSSFFQKPPATGPVTLVLPVGAKGHFSASGSLRGSPSAPSLRFAEGKDSTVTSKVGTLNGRGFSKDTSDVTEGVTFQLPRATADEKRARVTRRKALELLTDPGLPAKSQEIFRAHAEGKDFLHFDDYLAMLRTLNVDFGLPEPDAQSAQRLFEQFDSDGSTAMEPDEFFELFAALLRRNAFSRPATLSREFFVNKISRDVWGDYDKMRQLGAGTYGTAHLARRKGTKEERVVKVVAKARTSRPLDEIEQEILVLRQVDHPHVVRLFEWYEDSASIYLVIEALKGGTLQDVLLMNQQKKKSLQEGWIQKVVGQCADAMAYCHSMRLIHKDLKDENVMLLRKDPNFDEPFAVVIDLGVAEMFSVADPTCREIAGTPSTMAPEVWSGKFGPKCDVWSLGCIFFELLSGSLPFSANTIQPGPWLKLAERGPNWNLVKTSPQSRMLCKAMLVFADKARPTMKKVAQNQYFGIKETTLKLVPHEQFAALTNFCSEQQAKRSLLLELATRLPMSKSTDIINLFEGLDVDRSGEIEEAELEEMFRKMGVEDKELAHRTFEALDCNKDGSLSFSEFAAGALLLFKDMLEDTFQSMFNGYDLDRNGGLEPEEARMFLEGVGAAMNPSGDDPALVESLLAEVMAAGDGSKVTYEQLRDVVLGGVAPVSRRGSGAAAA